MRDAVAQEELGYLNAPYTSKKTLLNKILAFKGAC